MASAPDNYDATLLVFARAFDKRRVKYALIGGEAVSRLTRPRFTKDLDFLLTVPQVTLPGLLEELNELGCDIDLLPTIREWTQHQMIVFRYLGTRIDWLGPVVAL